MDRTHAETTRPFERKPVRAHLTLANPEAPRPAIRMQPLGPLALVDVSWFCPVRITRTEELTRDGNDDLWLVIATQGQIGMRYDDRAVELHAGAAALRPADLAGRVGSNSNGSALAVVITRETMRDMFGRAQPAALRETPSGDPALRLLRLYARSLMSDPITLGDSAAASLAERQIRELIAHLLDPSAELARAAPAGGLKAARLRAVIAGIEQHLTHPALSASWLGAKLGLSERYVQHLLAEQDLSFSDLVRRKRVERTRQILEEPVAQPPRIVDVAFAVGFGDLSSFNRAFRERYGCTPSDVVHRRTLN